MILLASREHDLGISGSREHATLGFWHLRTLGPTSGHWDLGISQSQALGISRSLSSSRIYTILASLHPQANIYRLSFWLALMRKICSNLRELRWYLEYFVGLIISGFEHQFGEIHPHFYMLVISITIIYNFYSTTAKSFQNYILVSLYIYLLPWPVNV